MESSGHTFKPGDVLAPKDWQKAGNVVIVVVEASQWIDNIPVYKVLANRETNSVDFELAAEDETWLPKHYSRVAHINIANYNWDDLKDILEGILKQCPRTEYKPGAILRMWKDQEYKKHSKAKGEEKMNEGIYKIGDILEFPEGYETRRLLGFTDEETRGLIFDTIYPGFGKILYSILLLEKSGNKSAIRSIEEKELWKAVKRAGHIDISALMFMENDEPDYEKMMTAYACVESANLRKLLAEETLKRVRAEVELEEKTEKNKELEAENARYLQRMREAINHLSPALYCNTSKQEGEYFKVN